MRYVLDANVALRWVLLEQDSDRARRLRDDYHHAIHDLIAPDSFSLECANSLTKKERNRIIPDSRVLWDDIMADAPTFVSMLSLAASTVASHGSSALFNRLSPRTKSARTRATVPGSSRAVSRPRERHRLATISSMSMTSPR